MTIDSSALKEHFARELIYQKTGGHITQSLGKSELPPPDLAINLVCSQLAR